MMASPARTSSLCSSRGSNLCYAPVRADRARISSEARRQPPGLTERILALSSPESKGGHRLAPRQVSALFGPRTSLTRQLCIRSTFPPRPLHRFRSRCGRSDGCKLARQSPIVRSPKKWPRGSARPAEKLTVTPASFPSLLGSPRRLALALGNWPASLRSRLVSPRLQRLASRPAVSDSLHP